MAQIKQKTSNRAKTPPAPVRAKVAARSIARGSHASSSKSSQKVKSVAVAKKSVKAATPKKVAAKATRKVVARKTVVKKPAAKKVVAAKPAKKVAKAVPVKAAKVTHAQKKTVPPKAAAVKKAVATKHAKPAASSRRPESSRKSVTISKPETKSVPKSKARVASPPGDNNFTMQDGRYALPATTKIDLPHGYKPSAKEEYMSPAQLQYFRNKLSQWRADLVEESRQTIESLRDEVRDVGDEAERATRETENSLELRTRDRYRKLIAKIDKALKRIEEGHYGFCEETDEDIGIDRLEARPIATLSLDAQERWEHRQKQMGD